MSDTPSTDAAPAEQGPSREEFCQRFKAYMLSATPFATFADGSSIADYADDVAPSYWDEPWQREEGPEECASADIAEWEVGHV